MISLPKNVYIDTLSDIVNEYKTNITEQSK